LRVIPLRWEQILTNLDDLKTVSGRNKRGKTILNNAGCGVRIEFVRRKEEDEDGCEPRRNS
jgi:hypothetical protein